jgi:LacI family transcriptional regulator
MKNISLKDIASRIGVSPTTVSFVLNGKGREKRISEEVIAKVEKLVKELDYKPNQMARGLRTGQTRTIGLMVEDISNHFFATLAKVIEDEADRHGYEVLYCSTEYKNERAGKLLRMLQYRQVDGYILTPTSALEADIRNMLSENKPLVLMDRYFPGLETHYVVVDNFQGAYMAADHLLKQGYQRIAIVTTSSGQTQMQQRLTGFRAALSRGDDPHCEPLELSIPFEKTGKYSIRQISRFLTDKKPDAVFFSTNYLGIDGLEAIKELGLKMPREIGMISFDDHAIFRLYAPRITCIAQPLKKIGERVIGVLMDQIAADGPAEVRQHVLKPELLIRESCGEKLHLVK